MHNSKWAGLFFLVIAAYLLIALSGCATYSPDPPPSTLPGSYDVAPGAEARTFETNDDLTLFGQWWVPDSQADIKAVVLLIHGTFVHSGFYAPWAEHLTDNGYAVFGIDLRGWGQSQGFGRRGFVSNYNAYLEDILLAYREIKSRYRGLPVFLQGESLGGTLALFSQIGEFIPAEGLVLNAPAIRPGVDLGLFNAPGWLADYLLWASSKPGEFVPNHPTLVPGWLLETMKIDDVIKDEAVQTRYKNDAHVVHQALPCGFLTALQKLTARMEKGLPLIRTPVIILHGKEDEIVPLSSSEFAMQKLGSSEKTLKTYEKMRHATLHDTGRQKVWADIIGWLDAQVRENS